MSEMNYDPMTGEPLARPRFTASFEEKLAAFLLLIPAYFYAKMISDGLILQHDPAWRVDLAIFLVGTIGLSVYLFFREKHRVESLLFFACLLASGISTVFQLGEVWVDYQKLLFVHGFLLYWILSFSNRLSLGESGCLLPLDALNVLFIVPFKRYFLWVRSMISAFRDRAAQAREEGQEKKRGSAVLWSFLALLASAVLFAIAVSLLSRADQSFSFLMHHFTDLFQGVPYGRYIGYFFMSLPIAAYVYGILGGFRRESIDRVRGRGSSFLRGLLRLRRVPPLSWTVLLLIFSAVYIVFFSLQWNWVIDAFHGICPPDPRTYARESFFALIWVSLINFLLLGITHNSARDLEKKSRILTAAKILLLLCNVVFCVIAGSKLVLYIVTHGFTPLRLQSSWLVVTLFLACVAAAVNILSGKKTMKYWMLAASLLLSGLCLF